MKTNEMKHTPKIWQREGNFIYALTTNTSPYRVNSPSEVNYFQCQVTGGGRDGATPEELSEIVSLIHSAPELLNFVQAVAAMGVMDHKEFQNEFGFRKSQLELIACDLVEKATQPQTSEGGL